MSRIEWLLAEGFEITLVPERRELSDGWGIMACPHCGLGPIIGPVSVQSRGPHTAPIPVAVHHHCFEELMKAWK